MVTDWLHSFRGSRSLISMYDNKNSTNMKTKTVSHGSLFVFYRNVFCFSFNFLTRVDDDDDDATCKSPMFLSCDNF